MKKLIPFIFILFSLVSKSQCSLLCNTDFENNTTGMILPPAYSGSNFVELNANMVSTMGRKNV